MQGPGCWLTEAASFDQGMVKQKSFYAQFRLIFLAIRMFGYSHFFPCTCLPDPAYACSRVVPGIFDERSSMEKQGLFHLYIGNGKGKTTAATGLAIRALGHGFTVLFAQFLKNTNTGEKIILEGFGDRLLFFRPKQRNTAFLWNMTPEELAETREDITSGWEALKGHIQSGLWDMVVLDEILDCIQCHLIKEEDVLDAIRNRPEKTEVVCTGRTASQAFCDLADYISVTEAMKHPYAKGIQARRGIEF